MTSVVDEELLSEAFELTQSPQTKLRPGAQLQPYTNHAVPNRYRPHGQSPQPRAASTGRTRPTTGTNPLRRSLGATPNTSAMETTTGKGAKPVKGLNKVLGELAEMRTQLETHQHMTAAKSQQLEAAQLEIATLKAELNKKVAPPTPAVQVANA